MANCVWSICEFAYGTFTKWKSVSDEQHHGRELRRDGSSPGNRQHRFVAFAIVDRAHPDEREDGTDFLLRIMGLSFSAHRCRVPFCQVRRFQMSRIAFGLTPYFLASMEDLPP